MRDPADARGVRAVSTLAHAALELPLEAAQQRPWLVTNDGHNCSPVGMLETKRKPCAVAPDVWLAARAFKSREFSEVKEISSTSPRRGGDRAPAAPAPLPRGGTAPSFWG